MIEAECKVQRRLTAFGDDPAANIPWAEVTSGKPKDKQVGTKWTQDIYEKVDIEGLTLDQFVRAINNAAEQKYRRSGDRCEVVRLECHVYIEHNTSGLGNTSLHITSDYPST